MKSMSKMSLVFGGVLAAASVFADELPVYKVTADVTDIDLTTGDYRDNALEGPAPGAGTKKVSGTITHGPASVDSPFLLTSDPNCAKGSTSELLFDAKLKGLDGSVPMRFSGFNRFTFDVQHYIIGNDWTDATHLQTDGNATARFRWLALGGSGDPVRLTFTPDCNLHKLLYGPNPAGDWRVYEFRIGLYSGSHGEFTVKDCTFEVGNFMYLGVDGSDTSGALRLENATVNAGADLQAGTGCPKDGSQVAMTNTVYLGQNSRLKIRKFKQECDPSCVFTFAGGTLAFNGASENEALISSWDRGRLIFRTEPGCDFRMEVKSGVHPFLAWNSANKPIIENTGKFVKSGAGTLVLGQRLAHPERTEVTGGTLRLDGDEMLPENELYIAADAVFDLAGRRQTVTSLSGDGHVTDSVGGGKLVITGDGDFSLDGVEDGVKVELLGSGTVTSHSLHGDAVTVAAGKVGVVKATGAYRYWRFKVEAIRGKVDMMQFSEVKLFSNGQDVTENAAVSWDTEHTTEKHKGDNQGLPYPNAEAPQMAVDGTVETKWLDWRAGVNEAAEVRDSVWLCLDFGEKTSVSKYAWYTANDEKDRDPVSWRFQASEDLESWIDVDVKENYAVTTDRMVLAYAWTDPAAGDDARVHSSVTVEENAELSFTESDLATRNVFANKGRLAFDEKSALTLVADEGAVNRAALGGLEMARPLIVKTGAGTTRVYGLDGFAGRFAVEAGEARFAKAVIDPSSKFFRWTVKRGHGGKILQLSEFSLYDAVGARLNKGLKAVAAGTDPAQLEPGTFAAVGNYSTGSDSEGVDKIVDGDTGTKWCLTNVTMDDPTKTDTWRAVVLRLPDAAGPAVAYSFTTANDSTPERNPTDWTMEASPDGVNWVTVDERTGAGNVPTATKTESAHFEIPGIVEALDTYAEAVPAFAEGSAVSVAKDARLVLDDGGVTSVHGLVIDVQAGAGTIANFKAAEAGEIWLENVEDLDALVGKDLIAFETPADVAPLRNWAVVVDGVVSPNLRAVVKDGRLTVVKKSGLMILIL